MVDRVHFGKDHPFQLHHSTSYSPFTYNLILTCTHSLTMSGLLGLYTSFLSRRPLVGNMASSAVLFATGDIIAQQAIEKKGIEGHDLLRTG